MKKTSDQSEPEESRPASKITGNQPAEEFIAGKDVPSHSIQRSDQEHGSEVELARRRNAEDVPPSS